MEINYDNMTPETLEEYIEFVDWMKVPGELITKELVYKFSSILPIVEIAYLAHKEIDDLLIDNQDPDIYFFYRTGTNDRKKNVIKVDIQNKIFHVLNSFLDNNYRFHNFFYNDRSVQKEESVENFYKRKFRFLMTKISRRLNLPVQEFKLKIAIFESELQ